MATQVMGILNITEDSFAESTPLVVGDTPDISAALNHAHAMVAQGADIIDVGGESTRPGARRIDPDVELARVLPVVQALAGDGITVSVDTTRAVVAQACIAAGAAFINDVSGGTADPEMLNVLAESGSRCILMHRRGESADMYAQADYRDVVGEVIAELAQRVDEAMRAGVARDAIILDPGLGFAKHAAHNWQLLESLPTLMNLGFPVLIGASRKRFLGELLQDNQGNPRATDARDVATATVSAVCAQAGVWAVRVHDVQSTKDALAVVSALRATAMGTPLGRQGLSKLPGSSATVNENGPVISLTGIEAFGRHGVFDFEREQGQMFGVDVQLTLAQTPQADMLSETIDYSAVTTAIANLVSGEPVDLIETLAERICVEVLNNYPCIHVQVTVHKPQAPLSMSFTDVAVTTARSR